MSAEIEDFGRNRSANAAEPVVGLAQAGTSGRTAKGVLLPMLLSEVTSHKDRVSWALDTIQQPVTKDLEQFSEVMTGRKHQYKKAELQVMKAKQVAAASADLRRSWKYVYSCVDAAAAAPPVEMESTVHAGKRARTIIDSLVRGIFKAEVAVSGLKKKTKEEEEEEEKQEEQEEEQAPMDTEQDAASSSSADPMSEDSGPQAEADDMDTDDADYVDVAARSRVSQRSLTRRVTATAVESISAAQNKKQRPRRSAAVSTAAPAGSDKQLAANKEPLLRNDAMGDGASQRLHSEVQPIRPSQGDLAGDLRFTQEQRDSRDAALAEIRHFVDIELGLAVAVPDWMGREITRLQARDPVSQRHIPRPELVLPMTDAQGRAYAFAGHSALSIARVYDQMLTTEQRDALVANVRRLYDHWNTQLETAISQSGAWDTFEPELHPARYYVNRVSYGVDQ